MLSALWSAQVDVKRVPEAAAKSSNLKMDQAAPVATVAELENYDAIIVGTGTRYGRMSSQMAAFLDQTGGLWMRGTLNGKVGAAFASSATQRRGQETTLFSIITNLMHVGLTIVGGDGSRQPSAIDLAGARFQGELVAKTAAKLFA
jgi:NAD(P)H dehydrogenase (quinone)